MILAGVKSLLKPDRFTRNIIYVFFGVSLSNFLNLLYQLFLAHRLAPEDFAGFNSLLSIVMLFATVFTTLSTAVAKYTAEFNAQNEIVKIKSLLSGLLRRVLPVAILTLFIFLAFSPHLLQKLKIYSPLSGYLVAALLALSWLLPIFMGGLQGLELFGYFNAVSIISSALKLILAAIFLSLGFGITGALAAFLIAILLAVAAAWARIHRFLAFKITAATMNFKDIFLYLFPAAASLFCFITLVSADMLMVRYYFPPEKSGIYSLAQMVGKIFLFLPSAISIVMLPQTSGLRAKKADTISTLKASFSYAFLLCAVATAVYNAFPHFCLNVLTGKAPAESVVLGRLFSLSMSGFSFLYILIMYFLSIKDIRFIKYLVFFTALQILAIAVFHSTLMQVQLIMCINAVILVLINVYLVFRK